MKRGFTLIELMVGVAVLAILTTTGVAVFLGSLRGSSQVEIRRTLDNRARLLLNGLARFLREAKITSLSGTDRTACLTNGSATGDSLVVEGLDGLTTTLSVSSGMLSSVSAQTVVLNPESVTLDRKSGLTYYFTWYCAAGVPDRLVMEFEATSVGTEGDTSLSNDYILDVVLRNTGQ